MIIAENGLFESSVHNAFFLLWSLIIEYFEKAVLSDNQSILGVLERVRRVLICRFRMFKPNIHYLNWSLGKF